MDNPRAEGPTQNLATHHREIRSNQAKWPRESDSKDYYREETHWRLYGVAPEKEANWDKAHSGNSAHQADQGNSANQTDTLGQTHRSHRV
jgi:hypothetical protein